MFGLGVYGSEFTFPNSRLKPYNNVAFFVATGLMAGTS